MQKITDYKVVSATALIDLSDLVIEAIADGWQPNGPATSDLPVTGHQQNRFTQTLVKYEQPSPAANLLLG